MNARFLKKLSKKNNVRNQGSLSEEPLEAVLILVETETIRRVEMVIAIVIQGEIVVEIKAQEGMIEILVMIQAEIQREEARKSKTKWTSEKRTLAITAR